MRRKEFIIIQWGGIGDVLLCTPAYRALKETYPDHRIIVYYRYRKHRDVLKCNPHIDSLRLLRSWAMWRDPWHLYLYLFRRQQVKFYFMFFMHIPLSWAYDKHAKEVVAELFDLGLQLKRTEVQLFFTEAEEAQARRALAGYRNAVLMQIHSQSSANHLWRMEYWSELVRQLPECTFIQIGLKNEPPVPGALDWRGRTTLREAFCLLKHADSFVSVESSLAHASNAFNTPGVVLFGDSDPATFGHDNNINVYKNLPCSPCFSHLYGGPCPYGRPCMEQISVAEVKEALIRQLNRGRRDVALQRTGESHAAAGSTL